MRRVLVLGAPSSLGISPYDDGGARRLDLAPDAFRARDIVQRVHGEDGGDVTPRDEYRDFVRPERDCRNEDLVDTYSRELASVLVPAFTDDVFVLLLGGDCSILLGALYGLHASGSEAHGLVYIDGHADFATLDESPSHSPCSMNLAIATGRARPARLGFDLDETLVHGPRVVHLGRKDDHQPEYGFRSLPEFGVLDIPNHIIATDGPQRAGARALDRVGQLDDGFWIHLDADVLDPLLMPAVDSPVPGGLDLNECIQLLRPLVRHPGARGLQLTIYDPSIDVDGNGAELLTLLVQRALGAA